MLGSQKQYFEIRSLQKGLHNGQIRSTLIADATTNEFKRLVEQAYSHHHTNVIFSEPMVYGERDTGIPSPEYITYIFHTDEDEGYFIKPEIRLGGPLGGVLNCDLIEERLLSDIPIKASNDLYFLVGEIGMGKTTLISHILANKGKAWLEEENYIVVHLDADKSNRHKVPEKIKALQNLYEKIIDELLKLAKFTDDINHKKVQSIDVSSMPHKDMMHIEATWLRSISSVIELTYRNFGKRVILFIDNLDYLYHINDRSHFSKKRNLKAKEAKDFIEYFINIFVEGGNGALATSGIKIMFSLRPDSLYLLQSAVHLLPNHVFNNEENIFFYKSPSTYEVLLGRYRLLKKIISMVKVEGKEKRMSELLVIYDKILDHYKRSECKNNKIEYCDKNLFQRLSSLSKQGLRQILEHMSNYSWLGDEQLADLGIELDERFAYQSSPSVLTFTTGGKRYFSQFTSAFPNFYLVDSSAASALLKEEGFRGDILRPHRHTYWLKRLIAEYVYSSDDCVHLSEILDVFMHKGDDKEKPNGYEESIVRLATASLCQTDRSNVMVAELDVSADGGDLGIGELRITERGKYCLDCYIDTFQYLQLIVDDYMLSSPKCIAAQMYYKKDYGYLVYPQPDYHKQSSLMVSAKARQVYLLLKVLDISLSLERELYPNVFQRLEAEGVRVPNITEVVDNISLSLGNLRKYLKELKIHTEYMGDSIVFEDQIRTQLSDAYAVYHD